MTENLYDVIIIGGGPAGLSAAQYASHIKLRNIVLDVKYSLNHYLIERRI